MTTVFGDRTPTVTSPAHTGPPGATAAKPPRATPPWWCAHRSRASAIGVLATASLVCLASAVAVVGFASTGSSIAALVALVVLAVGAANVVSGSFGAAWWARRASTYPEVISMSSADDPARVGQDDRTESGLPRRSPVVPAARAPRTPPHGGGRHAAAPFPGDEPTTQIPASGVASVPSAPAPAARPPGLRPVPTVGPPPHEGTARPAGGPTDPTEALPLGRLVEGSARECAEDPGEPGRPSPRVTARRAAARSGPKVRRVAGRRT